MFNSIVVRFFVGLWIIFSNSYKGSLLGKIVGGIKKFISILFKGSVVKNIFISRKNIFENSIFYNIYHKLIDLINSILRKINRYIKHIGNESWSYRNIKSLFNNDIEVIRTILLFVFSFGIGIIINNLVRGFYSGRSYIVAMVLAIGSIVGLTLKDNYKDIFNNSFCFNFIKNIFTIDEGGDNWW